ncbi:MAG: alpha/beta hydrolase-fold protein [Chitinophagales bacterium]|nr:alpha/beta hydrolase-fold protein [Chitinophagales bacterium]MDW8393909.1 alpha/beta hydrolase-fold protein [Chitinophagales bacterium]
MSNWLIGFLCVWLWQTQALGLSVVIEVVSLPSNTPASDPIYIAGTFNGWNPGHPSYQLMPPGGPAYSITLQGTGTIEFKFTRGSWSKVECQADGSFLPNRQFTFGSADTLQVAIAAWEDLLGASSTALPNVVLLSDSFFIPQLNRYRSIWLYLPDDYYSAPDKRYPVFYLQDGQNVFDEATAFAGEWQVDETLHALELSGDAGCIVVAVANGGVNRIEEYSPWVNPLYGGGQGDAYAEFLAQVLKPYIDAHYRTFPQRDFTAIGGSSLGGLIAFYTALKYNDVFSKAAVFSPSFWFDDSVELFVAAHQKSHPMRIRFVAGYPESSSMIPEIRSVYGLLRQGSYSEQELDTSFHWDGQHAEWFWAREFGPTYLWLFASQDAVGSTTTSAVRLIPQPAFDQVVISGSLPYGQPLQVRIYDSSGVLRRTLSCRAGQPVDLGSLPSGVYQMQVMVGRKRYETPLVLIR